MDLRRLALLLVLFASGCANSAPENPAETPLAREPASSRPELVEPADEATNERAEGQTDEATEESSDASAIAAAPLGVLFESFVADPIARWLVNYDRVAWTSTDLLLEQPEEELARLSREWFCYEDEDGWHAVFGTYDVEADSYDPRHHFQVDEQSVARAAAEPVPADMALAYARAIHASDPLLEAELGDLRLRMNTYVRPNGDGIDVWYLPAMLDDGRCIAGGEFCFHFDGEGKKFLGKDVVRTKFVAFTPDPEARIILSDPGRESPSMGNLFFAYSHFDRFDSIKIETERHLSLLGRFDGEYSWIHLEKDGAAEE